MIVDGGTLQSVSIVNLGTAQLTGATFDPVSDMTKFIHNDLSGILNIVRDDILNASTIPTLINDGHMHISNYQ